MEGGSIWKGMLRIYPAKVSGNTTALLQTPPSLFIFLLFQTPLRGGTMLFPIPRTKKCFNTVCALHRQSCKELGSPHHPNSCPFPCNTSYREWLLLGWSHTPWSSSKHLLHEAPMPIPSEAAHWKAGAGAPVSTSWAVLLCGPPALPAGEAWGSPSQFVAHTSSNFPSDPYSI